MEDYKNGSLPGDKPSEKSERNFEMNWDRNSNSGNNHRDENKNIPYNSENKSDEMSGPHRGKGPKNYTRSEERIMEDVCKQLSDDSFLDASGIEVSVKDGDVTLNGVVESRYSKDRAEDLAEDVTGVKNVQNNLRVEENVENSIFKNSVNNGNRPITSNTNYTTTKNRQDAFHG
jgi:hypothetical protein